MIIKEKWKRLLWFGLLIIFVVLTALYGLLIKFQWAYRNIPTHHFIGNRPSTVSALKEQGFPFSFLVIGDTRGSEIAETLIEMAFEKGNPSFKVILGDFVRKPDIWNHRFFLTGMTTEINLPFPVFLVSGNHDFDDTGEVVKRTERRVTSEVYESLYGVKDFDFVFNKCLFIIM